MKRIISFIVATLAIIAISVSLFISGRGHDVYFTNNAPEGVEPYKEISIKIDNNPKVIKVKNNKQAMAVAKGTNHKLIISYKENGEKREKEYKFKTHIGKETEISLVNIILDLKEPVTYKEIQKNVEIKEEETEKTEKTEKVEI